MENDFLTATISDKEKQQIHTNKRIFGIFLQEIEASCCV